MSQRMVGSRQKALWMVEASAGTGKTYRLISEVLLQVLRGVELRKVLLMTFSKKATAELAARLQERLHRMARLLDQPSIAPKDFERELGVSGLALEMSRVPVWRDRVARAVASLESASVMTLHSFCQRMLVRFGAELGRPETLRMVPDAGALRQEIAENALGRWLYGAATRQLGDLGRGRGDFLLYHAGLSLSAATELLRRAVSYPNALVVDSWPVASEAPVPLTISTEEALARLAAAVEEGGAIVARRGIAAEFLLSLHASITAAESDPAKVGALSEDARFFRIAMENAGSGAVRPLGESKTKAFLAWAESLIAGEQPDLAKSYQDGLQKALKAASEGTPAAAGAMGFAEAVRLLTDQTALFDCIHRARTGWFCAAGGLWRRRLSDEGWLTYDAMLLELSLALNHPVLAEGLRAAIRQEFEVCLVDEFQDTDDVQWSILRTLFHEAPEWSAQVELDSSETPGRHFVLVGDPKQSIYRFRGSDLSVWSQAKQAAISSGRVETLDTSRRTSSGLMHALNVVFKAEKPVAEGRESEPAWPFLHEDIKADPVKSLASDEHPQAALEFVLVKESQEYAIARRAAARIAEDRLAAAHACLGGKPRRAAVIVNPHKHGALMERELRALGISCRRREVPLMLTDEAVRVTQWLNFLAKPEVERHRRSLSTATWLGWSVEPLSRVVRKGGAEWAGWLEALDESRRVFERRGVMAGFERLMERRAGWEHLAAEDEGEARTDRLRQVLSVLEARASEAGCVPAELVRWMAEERAKGDDSDIVVRARPGGEKGDVVEIWTIHAAKGLEAHDVYVPFLARDSVERAPTLCPHTYIFSRRDAQGQMQRWLDTRRLAPIATPDDDSPSDASGKNLFAAQAAQREIDLECSRLTYVALTRARHRAVVWWPTGAARGNGVLQPTLLRQAKLPSEQQAAETVYQVGQELVRYVAQPEVPGQPAPLSEPGAVLRGWSDLAAAGSGALRGCIEVVEDPRAWYAAAAAVRPLVEAALAASAEAEPDLEKERAALEEVWSAAVGGAERVRAARRSFTSLSGRLKRKDADASTSDVGEAAVTPTDGEVDLGDYEADDRWEKLGGTGFGTLVHSFYENLDFTTGRSVDDESSASELLRKFAAVHARGKLPLFDDSWGPALCDHLLGLLDVALAGGADGAGCRLADVSLDLRADETNFDMRMCDSRRAAASILQDFEGSEAWRGYFERLEAGLRNEQGVLTGKMDLVFGRPRSGGGQRWFIVDYKTNRLNPKRAGEPMFSLYETDRLFEAMEHSDYLLQLLIYTVAWHRHLQRTLGAQYDYERDFGGVYYLYVRGMERGSERGQFFFKPPQIWVEKLSAAWGEQGQSGSDEAAE